jgi:hypothetical protein
MIGCLLIKNKIQRKTKAKPKYNKIPKQKQNTTKYQSKNKIQQKTKAKTNYNKKPNQKQNTTLYGFLLYFVFLMYFVFP